MKTGMMMSCLVAFGIGGCAVDAGEEPAPRALGPDGVAVEGEVDATPVATRVLAALTLPNGNTVTFSQFPDGGIDVLEMGKARTNAVSELAELADASPYELFTALAPDAMATPVELVADQVAVTARRARTGEPTSMPQGFRVAALDGFYARDLNRAFNACTATSDWEDHVGASPIGANCVPASNQIPINECFAYVAPLLAACVGTSCTDYALTGFHKTRSSMCAHNGDGTTRFQMGVRSHQQNAPWSIWFTHDMGDGAYAYHWYSNADVEKDFWRGDVRLDNGVRVVNRSWWVKF